MVRLIMPIMPFISSIFCLLYSWKWRKKKKRLSLPQLKLKWKMIKKKEKRLKVGAENK